jgi:uncharacterized pyridoxamine 5'-phosphate oxidase family protein
LTTPTDEATLATFLRRNHRAFLFCRDGGGRPIGYAMRSMTFHTGALYFATYTKSAKVGHLTANPDVACLVLEEDGPGWVSLQGRAEVYRPAPSEIETILALSSPEPRVSGEIVANVGHRLRSGKRTFIRVDTVGVRARA